jgi:secreted Zn-dependent insulinase-like peptidase
MIRRYVERSGEGEEGRNQAKRWSIIQKSNSMTYIDSKVDKNRRERNCSFSREKRKINQIGKMEKQQFLGSRQSLLGRRGSVGMVLRNTEELVDT